MRKRFIRTRRSIVGAIAGLAFVAAAGVGLAEITTGSAPSLIAASTTESQTTATQTTTGREGESADDQDLDADEAENEAEDDESDDESGRHGTTTSQGTTTGTTTGEQTTSTTDGDGHEKVEICHTTGSTKHPSHTIRIAAPAVQAHIAHGDEMGACADTGTTTAAGATSTSTMTTQATTTTRHQKKPKQQKQQKPQKPQKQKHSSGPSHKVKSSGHVQGNAGQGNGGSHGKGHGK